MYVVVVGELCAQLLQIKQFTRSYAEGCQQPLDHDGNNDAFSTGQSQETAGPSVGIIKVLQNRF